MTATVRMADRVRVRARVRVRVGMREFVRQENRRMRTYVVCGL